MQAKNTKSHFISTRTPSRSNSRGFTLIELLAVMSIMLILATIGVTSYRAMVSGAGINASLSHLRQSIALARQQAIMQGRSTYMVFGQDTNKSWYGTCMAEGTKTDGNHSARLLVDKYRADLGQVTMNSLLYNLSEDKAAFSKVDAVGFNASLMASEIRTVDSIWTEGCYYGWEISQRGILPRGFKFADDPPSIIRFKPDGTAVDYKGDSLSPGREIGIYEDIRPTVVYKLKVNFNGSIEFVYPN